MTTHAAKVNAHVLRLCEQPPADLARELARAAVGGDDALVDATLQLLPRQLDVRDVQAAYLAFYNRHDPARMLAVLQHVKQPFAEYLLEQLAAAIATLQRLAPALPPPAPAPEAVAPPPPDEKLVRRQTDIEEQLKIPEIAGMPHVVHAAIRRRVFAAKTFLSIDRFIRDTYIVTAYDVHEEPLENVHRAYKAEWEARARSASHVLRYASFVEVLVLIYGAQFKTDTHAALRLKPPPQHPPVEQQPNVAIEAAAAAVGVDVAGVPKAPVANEGEVASRGKKSQKRAPPAELQSDSDTDDEDDDEPMPEAADDSDVDDTGNVKGLIASEAELAAERKELRAHRKRKLQKRLRVKS
jgi:hypothetical protein